jgi:hypothetical protein
METGNSTLVYSVLPNVGKTVLKTTKTLTKNSLITAKDARITHVNFTVFATTFSEKKLEALVSYHSPHKKAGQAGL